MTFSTSSLQFWSQALLWLAFLTGAVAVGATLLSALAANEVSARVQLDAGEKIANAGVVAASAKAEVAKASEKAAEANERAAKANERTAELEKELAVSRANFSELADHAIEDSGWVDPRKPKPKL